VMVLLLSCQLRRAVAYLARDAATRAFRVDAVHLGLALHASQLLDAGEPSGASNLTKISDTHTLSAICQTIAHLALASVSRSGRVLSSHLADSALCGLSVRGLHALQSCPSSRQSTFDRRLRNLQCPRLCQWNGPLME